MRIFVFIPAAILITVGCGTVATEGSLLNEQVNTGIEQYQLYVENIIRALADTERAILSQRWEEIYAYAEEEVRAEHGLYPTDRMNHQQILETATLAALVREEIADEIDSREQNLIEDSRANADLLIAVNHIVTAYLMSQEELEQAKDRINQKIQDITGIDTDKLTGTVFSLIEELP